MKPIIAETDALIRRKANETIRLKPEYRRETAAWCDGYVTALEKTGAISEPERESLYRTLQGALASSVVGIQTG